MYSTPQRTSTPRACWRPSWCNRPWGCLVAVVEVVVVVGEAAGEALDDARGQVAAVTAPLLLGVALHERLEDVAADEGQRLLLEVGRLSDVLGGHLLGDLGAGIGRRDDTRPHLGEGVHVEGHVVHVAVEVGDRRVDVVVELGEAVDVVPDVLHGGVEDVGAVTVDLDALDVLGIDIAGDVIAAVDDQDRLAGALGGVGKDAPERPAPTRGNRTGTWICSFVCQSNSYLSFGTNKPDYVVPGISVADALSAAPTHGRSLEAFAGDGGKAGQAGVAHLAEVLARLDGTDVDLDGGDGDGLEGVQDRHACVRVRRRVDDNAVDLAVCLLDLVDDAALVVGLEDLDLVKALCSAGLLADLTKRS